MTQTGSKLAGLRLLLPVALALWIPRLAQDLVGPYTLRHVFPSMVIAELLALDVVLAVLVASTFAAGATAAMRALRTTDQYDGVDVLIGASAIFLVGHETVYGWLGQWAPAPALLALMALIAVVLASGGVAVSTRFRFRAGPLRSLLLLVLWFAASLTTAGSGRAGLLCLVGGLGAFGLLVESLPARLRVLAGVGSTGGMVAMVLAYSVPGPVPVGVKSHSKPNVVLLVVDTWRHDHTGPAGADVSTPRFETLSRQPGATWFRSTHSGASATIPSMKSLFTSLPASHYGEDVAGTAGLSAEIQTLAEAFKADGYSTAGFTANGLIKGTFGDGFESFWSVGGYSWIKESFLLNKVLLGSDRWLRFDLAEALGVHKVHGRTIVALGRRWLEQRQPAQPFLLYLHVVEPHWPYYAHDNPNVPNLDGEPELLTVEMLQHEKDAPISPARLSEVVARYDAEIEVADRVLGQLLDDLDGLGLAEDTLLVVTADHGEEFMEHGGFSHGHEVFEESVRVPLVIRWPSGHPWRDMPQIVDEPVSLLDLLPTLADYLDLPLQGERAGVSLRPVIEGKAREAPVISEAFEGTATLASWREGNLKARMVYGASVSPLRAPVEVYDLEADPAEQRPLALEEPGVAALVRRAREGLHARWVRWPDHGEKAPEGEEDAALQQLRALGYVD